MDNSEITPSNNQKRMSAKKLSIKDGPQISPRRSKKVSIKLSSLQSDKISIYPENHSKSINDIEKQSVDIVVNQMAPASGAEPIKFQLEPMRVICPFCSQEVETSVEEEFSCCTCLLYLLILSLCALPFLIISGLCNSNNCLYFNCDCKCCCDGTHTCPNCKKVIGFHDSKPSFC